MAFKYINPGFADLFDEVAPYRIQYANLNKNYSRTSGHAFTTNNALQVLYLERSREYWGAMGFRAYYSNKGINICLIDTANSDSVKNFINWLRLELIQLDSTRMIFKVKYKDAVIAESTKSLNVDTMYHLEFYVKDDPAEGVVKLWMNGELFIDYQGKTGEGNGFNRLEVTSFIGNSSVAYATLISDLIVQNTGRIGDMRVNVLPYKFDASECEWEVSYPVGFEILTSKYTQTARTYIFTKNMFTIKGKVESIRVSQYGSKSAIFKFCLFRKNAATGKYNAVQATDELMTSQEGVQMLLLARPLLVEPEDYLGFYSKESIHTFSLDKACQVIEGNDMTNAAEMDIFTQTGAYEYAPSVHAIFIPDDKIEGYKAVLSLPDSLIQYVECSTGVVGKKMLVGVEPRNMDIGRIDCMAVTGTARYEGESAVMGLSAMVNSVDGSVEGGRLSLTTVDKNYVLGVYDKNPNKNNIAWKLSDLAGTKFGLISKQ